MPRPLIGLVVYLHRHSDIVTDGGWSGHHGSRPVLRKRVVYYLCRLGQCDDGFDSWRGGGTRRLHGDHSECIRHLHESPHHS